MAGPAYGVAHPTSLGDRLVSTCLAAPTIGPLAARAVLQLASRRCASRCGHGRSGSSPRSGVAWRVVPVAAACASRVGPTRGLARGRGRRPRRLAYLLVAYSAQRSRRRRNFFLSWSPPDPSRPVTCHVCIPVHSLAFRCILMHSCAITFQNERRSTSLDSHTHTQTLTSTFFTA